MRPSPDRGAFACAAMGETMGKAAKSKQARRLAGPDRHLPDPAVPVPPGRVLDRAAMTVALPRQAHFWHTLGGRTLQCDLCYRACVLRPGETGWCRYRRNVAGAVDLPDHGVLARSQPLTLGYQGGIHTFLPGARAEGIGGTRCTARCAFCTSADVVWAPEKIPWQRDQPRALGTDGTWYYLMKAVLHPEAVIAHARRRGARAIVLAENEPLLSFEYTYDVARLAKAAGLAVVVYSNGFSTPEVVRAIAPYVDAVDVGIKGSLDEEFYATRMRSPGGPDAVRRALQEWRDAGVGHLLISDLIATRFQQTDTAQEAASASLYAWIVAELGPHTPVMLGHMHPPAGGHADLRYLLPGRIEETIAYQERVAASYARAVAAGLAYAHESSSDDRIHCHNCGGLLLERHAPATPDGSTCPYELIGSTEDRCVMFQGGCDCWSHSQHVTDGRCDHCGVAVPIVTLPLAELAAFRATIAGQHPA